MPQILLTIFQLTSRSVSQLCMSIMTNGTAGIPEKFMGSFKLDRSENFDEFLASKGINWFLRKMICYASVTKVFSHADEIENAYCLQNLSAKRNTLYKNWKLSEDFEAEGFDGRMHKIKFDYDPETESLKETHVRTDDPTDAGETYTYTVDGNTLVLVSTS
ncbi:unnamed protein product [Thelazia callipaeda]|uniref:FABP domain-containing protein n=1 Tax=Thelazia callipaeda TaxID=103827 RepID=A0A0N5D4F9_THECL|nr:unnamed protein product [Thelazia callipaeda]